MSLAKIVTRLRDVNPLYARILAKYPADVKFCFAYGSAVKQQTGTEKTKQMIDLIYCVEDSAKWHQENIKMNRRDYSSLKYLGSRFVAQIQEKFGAQVYFNTLIPVEEENVMIKYGVVSKEDLQTDLLDWKHLYMAGRLHKPIEIVQFETDISIQSALESNVSSAVHAALLLMPEHFSDYEFYHTLSNLSYSGDFRMIFGENKKKVENIVKPQLNAFQKLYNPTLDGFKECLCILPAKGDSLINFQQDFSLETRLFHLRKLPYHPRTLLEAYALKNVKDGSEDPMMSLAGSSECGSVVKKIFNRIVWQSSVKQSLKGIFTAGIFKSVNYSARKIKKMF